jgi:hypothetical protein
MLWFISESYNSRCIFASLAHGEKIAITILFSSDKREIRREYISIFRRFPPAIIGRQEVVVLHLTIGK